MLRCSVNLAQYELSWISDRKALDITQIIVALTSKSFASIYTRATGSFRVARRLHTYLQNAIDVAVSPFATFTPFLQPGVSVNSEICVAVRLVALLASKILEKSEIKNSIYFVDINDFNSCQKIQLESVEPIDVTDLNWQHSTHTPEVALAIHTTHQSTTTPTDLIEIVQHIFPDTPYIPALVTQCWYEAKGQMVTFLASYEKVAYIISGEKEKRRQIAFTHDEARRDREAANKNLLLITEQEKKQEIYAEILKAAKVKTKSAESKQLLIQSNSVKQGASTILKLQSALNKQIARIFLQEKK